MKPQPFTAAKTSLGMTSDLREIANQSVLSEQHNNYSKQMKVMTITSQQVQGIQNLIPTAGDKANS